MIDEVAFSCMKPDNQSDLTRPLLGGIQQSYQILVADLEKLGEMENAIGTQQWMEQEAQARTETRNENETESRRGARRKFVTTKAKADNEVADLVEVQRQ